MDPKTLKVGDIILMPGGTCDPGSVVRITGIELKSDNSVNVIKYDRVHPFDFTVIGAGRSCSCNNSFVNIIKNDSPKQNNGGLFKMLNQMMKKLLDADTQALIKAGYVNGDLLLTAKGQEALNAILFDANKKALLAMATEEIAEQEKDKK